jgi:hypothetical protein
MHVARTGIAMFVTNIRSALVAAVIAMAGAGAALAADRTIQPVVGPLAVGDLSLGFGPAWIEGTPSSVHFWQYEALGRANLPLGPRWNLEAEANAKGAFETGGSAAFGFPFQADGYLHLWTRHTQSSAWGIFGGVSPFLNVFTFFGAEFKHYHAHGSFGVGAAYTVATSPSQTETGWTLNASGNLYMNPNHRLGLAAAMMTGFPFSKGDPWQVTAEFEHRAAGMPASLWLSASRMHTASGNAWTALAGFRVFINDRPGATLQSHEQDVPWTFVVPQLVATGLAP